MAGGVHALPAPLALRTSRVDFDRDPLPDLILVNGGAQRGDGAHIFVSGREVLVEWQAALDHRRRPMIDDLKIGRADGHSIDAHQHLAALWRRHRLLAQLQFTWSAKNPALIVEGTGDFAAVIVSSGKTILSRSLLANQSEDRLQPLEIMVRLRRQSQYPIFRYFLDNDDERDRHWLELVAANAKTEGWVGDRFA